MMLLEIENLQISYPKHQPCRIVKGIDMHIKQGECIGLAGESGCGKTQSMLAFLGLLSRQAQITVTKAQWKGQALPLMDKRKMRTYQGHAITMIFQNAQTSLDPVCKIKTQFAECLSVHKNMKRIKAYEEALRYLQRVKLPDPKRILESYPHELSLGTCQRIMIAMALCTSAELWILDEPTSSLDTIMQAEIMELFIKIQQKEQKSMVFITHDLRLMPQLCDRVYIMRKGEIVEETRASTLFTKDEHHPYTAQLLQDCLYQIG